MTIYLPLSVLLFILLVVFSVIGELKSMQSAAALKRLVWLNAILSFVGAVFTIVTHFICMRALRTPALDETFTEWAQDMFGIWYQIALPVFFVLAGLPLLSSLFSIFDRKSQTGTAPKIRVITITASSALLLILAPFYGFMTDNTSVPLYSYVLWSGTGMSLAIRASLAVEYAVRLREHVKNL